MPLRGKPRSAWISRAKAGRGNPRPGSPAGGAIGGLIAVRAVGTGTGADADADTHADTDADACSDSDVKTARGNSLLQVLDLQVHEFHLVSPRFPMDLKGPQGHRTGGGPNRLTGASLADRACARPGPST